ncbi:EamA family transporter [Jannaschia formosa]|uniref:EamA family transporter n=1 Tax=Jannaschia formosa TaxID=2259592 RepID=UPI000E1B90C0|nr:DMT family transporter [Jannaschia formosa]TFL16350.1 EamA family transporter [Jannaschia formosa]
MRDGFGIALFVTAGIMWGSYTVLLRHWRVPTLEGAVAVELPGAVLAAEALGPWALDSLQGAKPRMLTIKIVVQGSVGEVLSVVALMAALQLLSTRTAAMLPTVTPAVAMLIAWAALGTRVEPAELLSAGTVIAGFALATRRRLSLPENLQRKPI